MSCPACHDANLTVCPECWAAPDMLPAAWRILITNEHRRLCGLQREAWLKWQDAAAASDVRSSDYWRFEWERASGQVDVVVTAMRNHKT